MALSQANRMLISYLLPTFLVGAAFEIPFLFDGIRPTAMYDYGVLFASLGLGTYLFATSINRGRLLWSAIYLPVMFIILFYVGFIVSCANDYCL